jgi:hypothetical protein
MIAEWQRSRTYRLDLTFPAEPGPGETATVAMVPHGPPGWNAYLSVGPLPAGAEQHETGGHWLVHERHGAEDRDWPIAYPSFAAARDAAHDHALRLLREEAEAFAGLADDVWGPAAALAQAPPAA